MKLYEKIEALIAGTGKPILTISQESGVSNSSLDSIIRRKQNDINLDMAFKLSAYFKVPIEYFANDGEEIPFVSGLTDELKELGVEYIEIARRMKKTGIPAGDLVKIIEAVKLLKK